MYVSKEKIENIIFITLFTAVPVSEVEEVKSGHVAWKYWPLLISKVPATLYMINEQ